MKKILCFVAVLLIMFVSESAGFCDNNRRITHRGRDIFSTGMNLAWMDFGNDMGAFDEKTFTKALDDISRAGGNSLRWWLHANGRYSPEFDAGGKVSGLSPNDINNLKKALDLARERGMLLCFCLWSFDMLQPNAGEENHFRNKKLIEDISHTRAYIDKALLPMVRAVKDHPALLCWEIFNEPEGMTVEFGWTPVRTEMKYIQQFINLSADAIHRESPGAKVTNGSWNIMANSDVDGFTNYYRDDRLIKAGNGLYPKGTLDFYEVHFFPQYYGDAWSPFHRSASYWELNKPIVIGEFPAKGLYDFGEGYKPGTTLTTREAYEYAYNNGYAGLWAWSWPGHDVNGDFSDAAEAMQALYDNHHCDIIVADDQLVIPGIMVNGHDGSATVSSEESVAVTIRLDLNGRRNQNADWWFAAVANTGDACLIYYFDLNAGTMVQGLALTYQGPLFELSDTEMIRFPRLPVDMYTFYFGIDLHMNGTLDVCSRQYHDAAIIVQTPDSSWEMQ